jgi:hypothetical protein
MKFKETNQIIIIIIIIIIGKKIEKTKKKAKFVKIRKRKKKNGEADLKFSMVGLGPVCFYVKIFYFLFFLK